MMDHMRGARIDPSAPFAVLPATRACVIAEAGVNHNGSLDMALQLVDAAAAAGVDAVKFQTFAAERLVRKGAPKAEYQKHTTGSDESQYEMLRRLELPQAAHGALVARCAERHIDFLSTPFDEESLDFLVDDLGLKLIKLGSGEITNAPLLLRSARKGISIILSTGMSTLSEVERALSCLAFGFCTTDDTPSGEAFFAAYASPEGQAALRRQVTLLHCTTEYPAPFGEVNLRSMLTMQHAFGLPVGYSDHTEGIAISVAAVALGASTIEKHFTLDKSLPGPDHRASLEPRELAALVRSIRQVEFALGSGLKAPSPSEWKNRNVVRKSLVARQTIQKGEIFSRENMVCKRPGSGVSPFAMWSFLGRNANRNYAEDELIEE